jgi:hypothetical protein
MCRSNDAVPDNSNSNRLHKVRTLVSALPAYKPKVRHAVMGHSSKR